MKTQKLPEKTAFTLLELLLSVAVVSIFSAAAVILVNGAVESAREQKLSRDVVTINAALSTFIASGGNLIGVSTATEVLDRMKTRVDDTQADQLVGVRAGVLDPRITPVGQSAAEGSSSAARVLWDAATQRFVLQHSGEVGIKEFVIDESQAGAEDPENPRDLVVEYSKKGDDKWVWEYAEHNTSGNSGPGDLPLGGGTPTLPGSSGQPAPLQLDPPSVSLPGGNYALGEYDGMKVALTDPNPAGVSKLFYSVLPGIWQQYLEPVTIDPGMNLETQAVTTVPEEWANSEATRDEDPTTPVQLKLAIDYANSSYDYVSLGGALEPGSYPTPTLVQPGSVSLTNGAAIPSQYLNSRVFNIYWTLDGTDPRSAPGPYAGDAFSGGFPGQEIAVSLDDWGPADTCVVKAYGKSHNTNIVTNSDLVTATLSATRIQLRPPTIDLASSPGADLVTISLQTDSGDMPLGARIFYSTDGSDPGVDANGEPIGGALYTGAFQLPASATEVKARVFPPALYHQWFIPSGLTISGTPLPPSVIGFTMSVSTTAP